MYMYMRIGNIWPLILFHLGWNLIGKYIAFYQNVIICLAGLLITIVVLTAVTGRNDWAARGDQKEVK